MVCVCVYLCVNMCMWVQVLEEARRGRHWEWSAGPLQEHSMLFPTEPLAICPDLYYYFLGKFTPNCYNISLVL